MDMNEEEIWDGLPPPRGKPVKTGHWVDANLMSCLVTGRSTTGILHFINQTPVGWFCKKQNTVESATYGSEFVAARQCVDQIIDYRFTLRAMGVPIDGPAWMMGDNSSVITQSTIPQSVLKKRHHATSYHRVREAVARKILYFVHVPGKENMADVLTKFLPWTEIRNKLEFVLYQRGQPPYQPPP